jgi:hypothetical protein
MGNSKHTGAEKCAKKAETILLWFKQRVGRILIRESTGLTHNNFLLKGRSEDLEKVLAIHSV